MPKTVEIPGVGLVDFPDSMSEDQIRTAIQTQILPHAQANAKQEPAANPGIGDYLASAGKGIIAGLTHPIDALAGMGRIGEQVSGGKPPSGMFSTLSNVMNPDVLSAVGKTVRQKLAPAPGTEGTHAVAENIGAMVPGVAGMAAGVPLAAAFGIPGAAEGVEGTAEKINALRSQGQQISGGQQALAEGASGLLGGAINMIPAEKMLHPFAGNIAKRALANAGLMAALGTAGQAGEYGIEHIYNDKPEVPDFFGAAKTGAATGALMDVLLGSLARKAIVKPSGPRMNAEPPRPSEHPGQSIVSVNPDVYSTMPGLTPIEQAFVQQTGESPTGGQGLGEFTRRSTTRDAAARESAVPEPVPAEVVPPNPAAWMAASNTLQPRALSPEYVSADVPMQAAREASAPTRISPDASEPTVPKSAEESARVFAQRDETGPLPVVKPAQESARVFEREANLQDYEAQAARERAALREQDRAQAELERIQAEQDRRAAEDAAREQARREREQMLAKPVRTPTGLTNETAAQSDLGPAAAALPDRMTGITPEQKRLKSELGPYADILPRRITEPENTQYSLSERPNESAKPEATDLGDERTRGVYTAGKGTLDPEWARRATKVANRIRSVADDMGYRDVGIQVSDGIFNGGQEINPAARYHPGSRMIEFALDPRLESGQWDPKVLHEVFHTAEDLGLVKPQEAKLIDGTAKRLGFDDTVRQKYQDAVDRGEIPALPDRQAMQGEVRANLLESYLKGETPLKGAPKGIIDRVMRFVDRTRNALRGEGFQTYDDFVQRFKSGEVGNRERNYGDQPVQFTQVNNNPAGEEKRGAGAEATAEDVPPVDQALTEEVNPDNPQYALRGKSDMERLNEKPLKVQGNEDDKQITFDIGRALEANVSKKRQALPHSVGTQEEFARKEFGVTNWKGLKPKEQAPIKAAYYEAVQKNQEERFRRGRDMAEAEMKYMLAQENNGRDWYTEGVKGLEDELIKNRPELADPYQMKLFKTVLAVTSPGVDPYTNLGGAIKAWDIYKGTGKMHAYDPKTGVGMTLRANGYEHGMSVLNQLVEEKGVKGAVDWLYSKHPVDELRKYYPRLPVEGGRERYGTQVLGPKVGAFAPNLNGIHTELTADKWWSRTWNRWMGTLVNYDKNGNVRTDQDGYPTLNEAPRNSSERALMRRVAEETAAKLGLNVDELQAVMWYGEQSLYRAHGARARSIDYATAAKDYFSRVRPEEDGADSREAQGRGPNAEPGATERSNAAGEEGLPDWVTQDFGEPEDGRVNYALTGDENKPAEGFERIYHWTKPGQAPFEIDPNRYGEGKKGAELRRKQNNPKAFVNRWYGMAGGEAPEQDFGPGQRFSGRLYTDVPSGKIYDLAADPQGFRQKYPDITEAERAVRDAGYSGYKVKSTAEGSRQPRDMYAMFAPERMGRESGKTVSFEIAFGDNSPYAEKYPSLYELNGKDPALAHQITTLAADHLANLAGRAVGVEVAARPVGPGGWMDFPAAPSAQYQVHGSDSQVSNFRRAVGYLAQQSGVISTRPMEGGPNDTFVVSTKGREFSDPNFTNKLWAQVRSNAGDIPGLSGYSYLEGNGASGIRISNVDGHWTPEQRETIKSALANAVEKTDIDADLHFEPAEIKADWNDWKENPNGETYLQGIASEGSPALRDHISGNLRQQADKFIDRLFTQFKPRIDAALAPELKRAANYALKENYTNPQSEALAKRVFGEPDERTAYRKMWDSLKDPERPFGTAFRQAALDRYARIGDTSKKLGRTLARESAYAAAHFSDRSSMIASRVLLGGGGLTYKGGMVTIDPSIKPLFGAPGKEGVLDRAVKEGKLNELFTYMAARRAERLLAEGREKLFTKSDIATAKALEQANPWFKDAADGYKKVNDSLIDTLQKTGVIDQPTADKWKAGDYFPFYRAVEEGASPVSPREMRDALGNLPEIAKLKGSEAKIDDPLTNVTRNVMALTNIAMKNVAANRAMRDAVDMGFAKQIPMGQSVDGAVTIRVNGRRAKFNVTDPLTYEAMVQGDKPLSSIAKFLRIPAKFQREMVTMSPLFVIRNAIRDNIHIWLNGGFDQAPIASIMKGAAEVIKEGPTYNALMNTGAIGGIRGEGGGALGLSRHLKSIASGHENWLEATLDKLERASQKSEAVNRANVFDAVMKRTGGDEAQAAWEAIEQLNFLRRGRSEVIKNIAAVVPFFNAHLQGLDVLYRGGIKGDAMGGGARGKQVQQTILRRGLMLAGASAAYALAASQTKAWQNATPEERDNNWFIPVSTDGEAVRIPIPFELGAVFKVLPERLMAWAMGQDRFKDVFASMIRAGNNNLIKLPIPQAALPMLEVGTNYSFFRGRPIVTDGMKKLEPQEQYDDYTSELAKGIAKGTDKVGIGTSPAQIDYLMKGYTGTLGMLGMSLIDSLIQSGEKSGRPDYHLYNTPGVGPLFQRPDGSGKLVEYYTMRDRAQQAANTLKEIISQGDASKAQSFMRRRQPELTVEPATREVDQSLAELRSVKKAIMNAPIAEISGTRKRELLDKIREQEIELTTPVNRFLKKAL